MRYGAVRLTVTAFAGALLLGVASPVLADDAGIHDYFLNGAGPAQAQATPADTTTTGTVPDQPAPVKKRHYASQRHPAKIARHEDSKEKLRHMHAHMRDMRNEKPSSSS